MTIMIFLFFFFLGIIGMFWYQGSRLTHQLGELSEEHAQLRVLLRALESRMDNIAVLEKARNPQEPLPSFMQEEEKSPGHDPLLHLSFDKTRENLQQDASLDSPLKLQ